MDLARHVAHVCGFEGVGDGEAEQGLFSLLHGNSNGDEGEGMGWEQDLLIDLAIVVQA